METQGLKDMRAALLDGGGGQGARDSLGSEKEAPGRKGVGGTPARE